MVAHVHLNAEALLRLVTWAKTGIETPMYASHLARATEIEENSQLAPGDLRQLVSHSAQELDEAMSLLEPTEWDAAVVTVTGRRVLVDELPWLRVREVAVHAVDLGTGFSFEALPLMLTQAIVMETVQARLQRGEGATLARLLTGRDTTASMLQPWL